MKKDKFLILNFILLTACSSADYKTPSVSNAGSMSEQTLCYRYAHARPDPAVNAEIERRHIDCSDSAFELDIGGAGTF